jgi:hypothetical protein
MPEMLLLNPAPRRRRRKNPTRTAAQRRATARLVALNRARRANPAKRRKARRRNPVAAPAAPVSLSRAPMRRRRRNPVRAIEVRRRRRNPAGLRGLTSGIMPAVTDALVQGGGAVAFDVLHGQLARFLPVALQRTPGQVGVGDAVKAVGTLMIGRLLNRTTRGLSMRAAKGALTVQAYELVRQFVPANMTMGYAGAGMITQGMARISPNRGIVGRYTAPSARSPLLNAYTAPGSPTPLLSRAAPARVREGFIVR